MPRRKPDILLKDIKPPKDYKIRRDGISQSLLSVFPLCRMKFLLKMNRWKKKNDDLFVVFGNICHDVLEWAYKRGKFPTRKVLIKLIDRSCNGMEDRLSAMALQNLPLEAGKAEVVLWEYFKFYRKDFKDFKFEELEKVFKVKLWGIPMRGKKDGIFKSKFRTLMEHKTKIRFKEELWEKVLNFDFQNLTYITCDEESTGKSIKKVLYNIIRNPSIRQKKDEDFREFLGRITDDIKSRPEFYFKRYHLTYTKDDKKVFKEELKSKLLEAEAFLRGDLPVYKNQSACEVPYKCEFLEACANGNMRGYEQGKTLFPEL